MNRMMKWFLAVVVTAVVCGCTTTKYVTLERVTHDTTYVAKHQRDSIWLHDSIRVSENGDTIRIDRWHTKYVEREVHDTLYQSVRDTIPQPYPVTEYVEKSLGWWQKGLIWIGIVAMMAVVVIVAWKLKKFLPVR